ncbi:DUF2145 domain-containing protein [Lysobacter silvisoli]|uniref:DUF2145 domain-containing protein n=1 Tax=Lysobacter silvisoli TaxID=2293254 RepID=A0A371K151_9GAMM|nr:DUF2145 domain-containing protein [Lysobacter silvisoli]RDZ27618.1 DUF2145 domain-containing protein [Lysobacter silvisoli]
MRNPTSSWRALILCAALLAAAFAPPALAGTHCETQTVPAEKVAAAAATALRVAQALDQADAPAALVARVGTDLSAQGLVYSHVGFAVRDHANGRWTVVHLLNECGSDRSRLYAQGLVNFFSDDLVNQDARIVWLQPAQAQRLAARMQALPQRALHQPHYSLIARPGSKEYQNSTAWVLEMLAASADEGAGIGDRRAAYRRAQADGFKPDRIHVPYTKRVLGGLFAANVAFTDHPVATRLSGDYPVVTVRSIFDYLQRCGYIREQREWRGGRLMAEPGPA